MLVKSEYKTEITYRKFTFTFICKVSKLEDNGSCVMQVTSIQIKHMWLLAAHPSEDLRELRTTLKKTHSVTDTSNLYQQNWTILPGHQI